MKVWIATVTYYGTWDSTSGFRTFQEAFDYGQQAHALDGGLKTKLVHSGDDRYILLDLDDEDGFKVYISWQEI